MSPTIYEISLDEAPSVVAELQASADGVGVGSAGVSVVEGGPTAIWSSTLDADMAEPDNGEWEHVSGHNVPSAVDTFTTSRDEDVPGGTGLYLESSNGNDFLLNFQPLNPPAAPAVGESITWRWYHKMIDGDGDGNYHPWALGGDTGSPTTTVIIQYRNTTGTTYGLDFQFSPTGTNGIGNNFAALGTPLSHGAWYRYEMILTRETSTTWSIQVRIYNLAGTLLLGPGDFFDDEDTGSGQSDGLTLDEITWTESDPNVVTLWTGFGNGVGTLVNTPHEQDRWAAVAAFEGAHIDIPYPQAGES